MSDWFKDVLAFHEKFGCYIGKTPAFPSREVIHLRNGLVTEEFTEFINATMARNLAGTADAMVDLMYVILGTAVSLGIDLRPVWDAVHATNMAKVGGGKRDDGKVLKPPGWVPPNIEKVLAEQEALA